MLATANTGKIEGGFGKNVGGTVLGEDSKIDLDVVDDTTVSDTPPWSQCEPQIYL